MLTTIIHRHLRHIAVTALLLVASLSAPSASAGGFGINLDSIAAWGKFPRFCVNTYRWGDKFFNGYDTTYVAPTGYKFNVKVKADSWIEQNQFRLDKNKYLMDMYSYPSTSTGVWLTYMAVSAGYDVNVSKLLNLTHSSRKRWNFQFNCMLFAADFYIQSQDSKMKIYEFGPANDMQHTNIRFDGLRSKSWGMNAYYFFNHKHYSQAAAFSYGRIQRRSSGSLYAGFSVNGETYDFDFSQLPQNVLDQLPDEWTDYRSHIHDHNYALKIGYAYNFVTSRHFMIGLSEAPSIGVRHGYVNDRSSLKNSLYTFNSFRASAVWNNRHWFAGVVLGLETNLFSEQGYTRVANNLNFQASVGYRFNLW